MKTEKLRGIVLREWEKGESNKQILLLAKGSGRVLLSARGARKANSRLLAATQLFCYADFVACTGKGFYSITQAELLHSFYPLRTDIDRFSEATYLAELAERTTPAGMEQDAVLELLYYAFLVMERGILPPKLVGRIFECKLLQLHGLLAAADCHSCGESGEELYFDSEWGAFFCVAHRRKESILVYPAVRQAFARILSRESKAIFSFQLSDAALAQFSAILQRYLSVHMEVRLKSRDFFAGGERR